MDGQRYPHSGLRRAPVSLRPGTAWRFVLVAAILALAPFARAQEMDLKLESFGAGNWSRAGEWAGVRVVFTDRSERSREVMLRLHLRDPDGDRPTYQRVVTTNPGRGEESVWLYCRVPFWLRDTDPITITAHEAREPEAGGDYLPGRQVARAVFPVRQVADARLSAIGVVGRSTAGLDQYGTRGNDTWLPGGHEATDIVAGLAPDTLPDRWQGLMQFDVIAWTDGRVAGLSRERADALREWVERGGHLVVVIPNADRAAWPGDALNNPLYPILPLVSRVTTEGVDLTPYRQLLVRPARPSEAARGVRDPATPLPSGAVVHSFAPLAEAGPGDAMPVLTGPDGRTLVVRRLVGTGAVTLVGLDLASRILPARGLPDAEQLWHRVLGRRGQLFSEAEMNPQNPDSLFGRLPPRGYAAAVFDRFLGQLIDKTGTAVAGVTLGFVVFLLYWLVAAPLAFAALKRRNMTQHSWVVFVAAAGVFTGIAWGGATALRPSRTSGSHVTLIDHVFGQPVQRTRTWVSLLLPWYGDGTLTTRNPDAPQPESYTNLVAPWDRYSGGGVRVFPDTRAYAVPARSPDTITFPTRSTIKEFQIDWAGGPVWAMPRPVSTGEGPGEIALVGSRQPASVLSGVLRHELPGPLENVLVVLVRGQRPLRGTSANVLWSDSLYWWLDGAWDPDQPLDLAAVTAITDESRRTSRETQDLLENLRGAVHPQTERIGGNEARVLTALGFLSQFKPPQLGSTNEFPPALRSLSHGWDLGLWFTQPSVIVVGILGPAAECPTPLFVGPAGSTPRKVKVEGRTVVRWVYPLAPAPIGPSEGPAGPEEEEPG